MDREAIQNFIDEDINPALDSHGGWLAIHDFNDEKKDLQILMGGGCQGCASARMTLKMGIENALREEFPELNEIEDVTDHTAGATPYYQD